jgi:hypothetical protein
MAKGAAISENTQCVRTRDKQAAIKDFQQAAKLYQEQDNTEGYETMMKTLQQAAQLYQEQGNTERYEVMIEALRKLGN